MQQIIRKCCFIGGLVLLSSWLSGCATPKTFTENASGFHVAWEDNFSQEMQASNRLSTSQWRVDMSDDMPGTLAGNWVMKGSNVVTAAAMRYGLSEDANSLKHCLEPGGGWQDLATNKVLIDGLPFTHYQLRDAGMSHYREVDAYRSLYDGRCLAIDLIVKGTDPEVYDPPAKPPFSVKRAKKRLHSMLMRVQWVSNPWPELQQATPQGE